MQRTFLMQALAPALLALALLINHSQAATNPPGSKTDTNATASKSGGKSGPSAAAVELPIPQSVFMIPKAREDGIDPFFPTSERFRALRTTTSTSTNKPPPVVELVINGFSVTGNPPNQTYYVTINGRTLALNEEKEVVTPQGRSRVRVIEIRPAEEIAVIEANGERRELRLRRAK